MPTTRNFSWREFVEKIDGPTRNFESNHPVVYRFGDTVLKRDKGNDSILYSPTDD